MTTTSEKANVAATWDGIPDAGDSERVWGPDLFAWAYDTLEASGEWRGKEEPAELQHAETVIAWRDQIRAGDAWVSRALLEDIRAEIVGMDDIANGLLMLVMAIDRAYVGIRLARPCVVGSVGAQAALVELWEEQGALQRAASGLVLRKGAYWQAGSALSHYCTDLARIPTPLAERVTIRTHDTPTSLGYLLRHHSDTANLNVAFVPTLNDMSAMAFVKVDRGAARLFSVELDPGVQQELAERSGELVESLEAADANVAVLPETVVNAEVVEHLRRALIANHARCVEAGRLPALRLLVAGVCGERSNVVRVLGADGRTLVIQPKTQRWRLDESQLGRYGLLDSLGSDERVEDIAEGHDLAFVDDPGFGRLAVYICEDLARGDPAWLLSAAATPNVILSPVCDASFAKQRWAYKAAERLAEEPGALTLVANSFVLADRQQHAEDGTAVQKAGVAIVMHPADWDQTEIIEASPGAEAFHLRSISWKQAWG